MYFQRIAVEIQRLAWRGGDERFFVRQYTVPVGKGVAPGPFDDCGSTQGEDLDDDAMVDLVRNRQMVEINEKDSECHAVEN